MIRSMLKDSKNSKDSIDVKDLVLDIERGNCNPGTRVVMEQKKVSNIDSQLWYDDVATGTIRSKLNDLCLDVKGILTYSRYVVRNLDEIVAFKNRIQ